MFASFQSVFRDPLPPNIAKPEEVPNDQAYPTTTGNVHDPKFLGGPYKNDIYKKAPGHWKVDYVKDHIEKVNTTAVVEIMICSKGTFQGSEINRLVFWNIEKQVLLSVLSARGIMQNCIALFA
jgi:hypothetical protein